MIILLVGFVIGFVTWMALQLVQRQKNSPVIGVWEEDDNEKKIENNGLVTQTQRFGSRTKKAIANNVLIEETIRRPTVAGSFYPVKKVELDRLLDGFLDSVPRQKNDKELRMLIVPHAGLVYSGQTAAWGFGQIEKDSFKRVLLLGVSHNRALEKPAVDGNDVWHTPLGSVAVDQETVDRLASSGIAEKNSQAHKQEHSLEMEVLFLQKVLVDFEIVPILVSQMEESVVANLGEELASLMDEETLLVVSTDLSHYPSGGVAELVDRETLDALVTGKRDRLESMIAKHEAEDHKNLDTSACGLVALRVALEAVKLLEVDEIKLLNYSHSGMVSGNNDRVVGYGAVGFWGGKFLDRPLSEKEKAEAIKIANEAVNEYVLNQQIPRLEKISGELNQRLGVFVTIKKNGELRGCIGEFEPKKNLAETIQDVAIKSATRDPRFPPVSEAELGEIEIELSVLSPWKKINNWQDIELGKHGVVIELNGKRGTFLPQVSESRDWTKESFLGEICVQKMGLEKGCFLDPKAEIYTYTAQVF